MDRFHLMSTFVAVVDTGGFAGASRKLNLSPPAVTRAVAELEEELASVKAVRDALEAKTPEMLWLADLGPAVGVPAEPAAPKAAVRGNARVLPDKQFDLPSLRAMNANVNVGRLRETVHYLKYPIQFLNNMNSANVTINFYKTNKLNRGAYIHAMI